MIQSLSSKGKVLAAAILQCLLYLLALPPTAWSQDPTLYGEGIPDPYSLEVCPDAHWRDLPFLSGPSSRSRLDNATHWDGRDVREYGKEVIAKQLAVNIVFACLAFVLLAVFTHLRCCRCFCKAATSDTRAEPPIQPSGWRLWLPMGLLVLLAAATLGVVLAGIPINRAKLDKVWPPVEGLNAYLNSTTDALGQLAQGLDDVLPHLDALASLTGNLDFPQARADVTNVATYLDLPAADPNPLDAAIANFGKNASAVQSLLAATRVQLTDATASTINPLAAGAAGLSSAVSLLSSYSVILNAVSLALTPISNAASAPLATSDVTTLEFALSSADLAGWQSSLSGMQAALDAWQAAKSAGSLATLATATAAMDAAVADLQGLQSRIASTALGSYFIAWGIYGPSYSSMLSAIEKIQANLVLFDDSTTASIARLRAVYTNAAAMQAQTAPAPLTLAADLSTFSTNGGVAPAAVLAASLNQLHSALGAVPDAPLTAAKVALSRFKSALSTLQPKLDVTSAALAVYKAYVTQANLDTLKSSLSSTGNITAYITNALTAFQAAAADAGVLAVQDAASAANLASVTASISSNVTAVTAAASAVSPQISQLSTSLNSYASYTGARVVAYNAMPSRKSEELASLPAAYDRLEAQLVKVPPQLRVRALGAKANVSQGRDDVQSKVVGKIARAEDKNAPRTRSADRVVLAIATVLEVCAFGLGIHLARTLITDPADFQVFLVAVLALLLFLLAIVYAGALAVLQDGCYHTERLVWDYTDPQMHPLLGYYFFSSSSSSAQEPLKQAQVVDVDQVLAELSIPSARMVADLMGSTFHIQPALLSALNGISAYVNGTAAQLQTVLSMADVASIRPLYTAFKSVPCCQVARYYATMWALLTAAGWLLMVTVCVATYLLRILGKQACGGLKFNRTFRIEPEVTVSPSGRAAVVPDMESRAAATQAVAYRPASAAVREAPEAATASDWPALPVAPSDVALTTRPLTLPPMGRAEAPITVDTYSQQQAQPRGAPVAHSELALTTRRPLTLPPIWRAEVAPR